MKQIGNLGINLDLRENFELFLCQDERSQIQFGQNGIINNSSLPKDAQTYFDSKLLEIGQKILVGVTDLAQVGLVTQLPSDKTLYEYQKVSEGISAKVSMEFDQDLESGRLAFKTSAVPIPVFHKYWSIGNRESNVAQGNEINVSQAHYDDAAKKVALSMEECYFNGLPDNLISINDKALYGCTNHPNRIAQTTTTNWLEKVNYENIRTETLKLIEKLRENRQGLYNNGVYFYYSSDLSAVMDSYKNQYSTVTIKNDLSNIGMIGAVKMAAVLPAKTIVLMDMDMRSIEYVAYQSLSSMQFYNNMQWSFVVFNIGTHVIKEDYNDKTGVLHGTIKS